MSLVGHQPVARFVVMSLAAWSMLAGHALSNDEPKPAPRSAVSLLGTRPGEERSDNELSMKLAWCPPGKFMMGEQFPGEVGRVEVTLTRGFWIGRYEVTQREYQQIIGKNPSQNVAAAGARARFPVEQVDPDEAMEFCRRLTESERKLGRLSNDWEYTLPTDAQWEYACRAGTTTRYSFGDKLTNSDANLTVGFPKAFIPGQDDAQLSASAVQVGSYKPNAWGLYDMHGNVGEWTLDWWAPLVPGTDPLKGIGQTRIFRGAGTECGQYYCHSGFRRGIAPGAHLNYVGFRVTLQPVR